MTAIRITVNSSTLGDIEIRREYPLTSPFDDKYTRNQIADLLAAATEQIHAAYGITKEQA